MKNKVGIISVLCIALLSLGACSHAKDKLGLTKKSPDEFQVVKRAPLAMPPDYALRPPSPGAPRPQEQSPQEEARQTVFGGRDDAVAPAVTGEDAAFLNKAGAAQASPAIRQQIDAETTAYAKKDQPVIKKLLGMNKPEDATASVVNAKAESDRLKNNKDQGKPVTAGETPSVEQ